MGTTPDASTSCLQPLGQKPSGNSQYAQQDSTVNPTSRNLPWANFSRDDLTPAVPVMPTKSTLPCGPAPPFDDTPAALCSWEPHGTLDTSSMAPVRHLGRAWAQPTEWHTLATCYSDCSAWKSSRLEREIEDLRQKMLDMNKQHYKEMLEQQEDKGKLSCQHQAELNELRLKQVVTSCKKAEEFHLKETEYQEVIKSLKHELHSKDDELEMLGAKLEELQEQLVEKERLLEKLKQKQKQENTDAVADKVSSEHHYSSEIEPADVVLEPSTSTDLVWQPPSCASTSQSSGTIVECPWQCGVWGTPTYIEVHIFGVHDD